MSSPWAAGTSGEGVLYLTQSKTGRPHHSGSSRISQAIIDATPIPMTETLMTSYGQPFTSHGFGLVSRPGQRSRPTPRMLHFHGLRKAACSRLAEAGQALTSSRAISGHRSLSQVQHYTKQADQARLARTAVNLPKVEIANAVANLTSGLPIAPYSEANQRRSGARKLREKACKQIAFACADGYNA